MKVSRKVIISLVVILLFSIVGCDKKEDNIKIATKPMTEQFILGEMLKIIIEENTDLNVDIILNIILEFIIYTKKDM